jgi:hypothetical protein
MKKDNKRWRLIIKDGQSYYKICCFWGLEKDETLFFKLYPKNKKGSELHDVDVETEEKLNPDGTKTIAQKINLQNTRGTGFMVNKRSFHPTGYTHVTDFSNPAQRHKSGIKTLPFNKIETYQQLALIFPENFKNFPEIKKTEIGKIDIILDINLLNNSPFQIEIFIVNNKKYPPHPLESVCIEIFCGEEEKHTLFVRCVQSKEMLGKPFPPHTLAGTLEYTPDPSTLS